MDPLPNVNHTWLSTTRKKKWKTGPANDTSGLTPSLPSFLGRTRCANLELGIQLPNLMARGKAKTSYWRFLQKGSATNQWLLICTCCYLKTGLPVVCWYLVLSLPTVCSFLLVLFWYLTLDLLFTLYIQYVFQTSAAPCDRLDASFPQPLALAKENCLWGTTFNRASVFWKTRSSCLRAAKKGGWFLLNVLRTELMETHYSNVEEGGGEWRVPMSSLRKPGIIDRSGPLDVTSL